MLCINRSIRYQRGKEGDINPMKFVKFAAIAAFAVAALGMGACASKKPAPPPPAMGTMK